MREVCDNTILRNDRRDEFMIGHIEGGVIDVYSLGSHAFFVPHVGDFLGRALFDLDVLSRGGGEVDGRTGCADVEGDAVVFGEDGDT